MIYLDASCGVKIFLFEEESAAVAEAIKREPLVLVSSLAELEAMVQL